MSAPEKISDSAAEIASPAVLYNGNADHAKLTDDVLCEIYYILAEIDRPLGPRVSSYSARGSLGWIRMTHVCRQWRYVGINLPVLWARIACVFPPDIQTVLDRTKNMPLVIDLAYPNNSRKEWTATHLLNIPVTRSRVYMDGHSIIRTVGERTLDNIFAGRTFPILEKLSLRSFDSVHDFKQARKAMNAPALAELEIDTLLPVDAPSLKTLRCGYGYFWHWNILLNFVRSFPLLEKLSIACVYDDAETFEEDWEYWQEREKSERVVAAVLKRTPEPTLARLPLKSLTMDRFGPNAYKLFKHLDLPTCTKFDFNTEKHDELWSQILSLPAITFPARQALSILLNFATETESYTWRLSFTEKHVWLPPSDTPDIYGSITMSHETDRLPDFLNAIPTQDANGIQELAFGHDMPFIADEPFEPTDHARWAPSLNRFFNVTVLHIYCYYHMIFFTPDFVPILTNLHTVVLIFNGPFGLTMDASWDRLREVLAARKTAGRPLARLIFRGNALCHRVCPDNSYAYCDVSLDRSYSGSDDEGLVFEGEEKEALDKAITCLQRRQISFEAEAQLVDEVVDERSVTAATCHCLRECCDYPPY